jgi:hypothetical protein
MSLDEAKKRIVAQRGDKADQILQSFQQKYPKATPYELFSRISGMTARQNAVTQAERKAAQGGAPAYLYWFQWQTPILDGRPRAFHCAELPFVVLQRGALRDDDRRRDRTHANWRARWPTRGSRLPVPATRTTRDCRSGRSSPRRNVRRWCFDNTCTLANAPDAEPPAHPHGVGIPARARMTDAGVDVRDRIVAFKRSLAPRRETLKRAYAEATDHVRRAVDAIVPTRPRGGRVVPEVRYTDIRSGTVPETTRRGIRKAGCAVVRGVFPASLAGEWFAEIGEYLDLNRYEEREADKRSLDRYFSALKAGKPQIFNIYWSKPQVMARQDPKLAETRAFLDRLWKYEGAFESRQTVHLCRPPARRQPGDKSLGLSPHMDAGTVERWNRPGLPESLRARLRR